MINLFDINKLMDVKPSLDLIPHDPTPTQSIYCTSQLSTMDEYLIPLKTPCVYYDPSFLPPDEASAAFTELLNSTPWEKSPKINRWVTLMELPRDGTQASEAGTYKYRDAPGKTIVGFPPVVHKMKLMAEEWYNSKNATKPGFQPVSFNVCLLNYYPTPSHRLGWHSDREELGRSTPIASISLGCPRTFLVRSKTDGMRDRTSIRMENGSLVLMENICQRKYLHSVPKEDAESSDSSASNVNDLGRINLTFRCKDYEKEDSTTPGELEHERRDHWIDAIQKEGGDGDVMAAGWKADDNDNDDVATSEARVFGDEVQFYNPSNAHGSVEYVVKTNIGAERYCAAELEEVLDVERYMMLARPFGVAGYVAVCLHGNNLINEEEKSGEGYASEVKNALLQLRTAHHILQYHDHFDLEDVVSFSNAAVGDSATAEDKTTSSIVGEDLYQYYKDRLVSAAGSLKSLADLETGTFRVTSDRVGKHAFQAPEVER
jgi:alkylated DNA repair dioxygenase AlkB/tRNA(Ser,Leu) C12 N-acetylase TAN1